MLQVTLTLMLAQSPAADAVKAADTAMTAADFARALELLEAIDPRTARAQDLEAAALLRAECLMTLKRPDEADAAFADAIKVNPLVELAPNAAPRLIAALARVKTKMIGSLVISSNLNGAMALLDGKRIGPLPVTARLVAGKHLLKIDSEGAVVNREVEVFAGQSSEIALDVTTRQTAPVLVAPAPASRSKGLPFTMIGAGLAVAVTGSVLFGTSLAWNSTDLGSLTIGEAKSRHDSAELQHHFGIGAVGVGVAVAVTGAILLFSSPETAVVVVAPSAGGASIGFAGRF